jgi:hypothetical protein
MTIFDDDNVDDPVDDHIDDDHVDTVLYSLKVYHI